jgi:hypothetical protein
VTSDDRRDERERRAEEAMAAIQRGANPAEEAFRLAEAFSTEQEGRFAAWWRRVVRRRRDQSSG